MRARWEGLHAALVRSVTTLQADQQFREAQGTEAVLARFESPVGLIEYLTTKSERSEDRDDKDAIYAALVRAVQRRAAWAKLAKVILWCGLWPALDHIFRHRFQLFKKDPDALVEGISVAFTMLIGRMDLSRVHRVAATLIYSTDRDVMDERRRERAAHGLGDGARRHNGRYEEAECRADWADLRLRDAHGQKSGGETEPETPPPQDSELGLPVGLSFDGELEALRARILPIGGADTDLLLAVLVLDQNQREAGERLGISHELARKRFQRALARVRDHFAAALSQSAIELRVSGGARVRPQHGGAQR